MTNQWVNQAADDWAKQNLVRGMEIKPLYSSVMSRIMVGLGIGFLVLIFLGIPSLIFYSSAVRYATGGWSNEVSRGFTLGSIFLLAFMVFASFILFYLWSLRRNQVKLLTSEGVFTRDGKHFCWKHLQNLKFIPIETEVQGSVLLRAMTRAMYTDIKKIKVEMFFSNASAPAIIPPLIANQHQILELLKTVPVEVRV